MSPADLQRLPEGRDVAVEVARGGERALGARRVGHGQRLGQLLQRAGQAGEEVLGAVADQRDGMRREEQRGDGEGDAAADHPLEDAIREGAARRGVDGDEDDGRDGRLVHEQLAAAAQDDGRAHGQDHEQPELQRAAVDHLQQRLGDHDAEQHAADQLHRALRALPVAGAEADHGGDGGERRALRRQEEHGEVPGGDRRGGGLEDGQHARAQPTAQGRGHAAAAGGGENSHERSTPGRIHRLLHGKGRAVTPPDPWPNPDTRSLVRLRTAGCG